MSNIRSEANQIILNFNNAVGGNGDKDETTQANIFIIIYAFTKRFINVPELGVWALQYKLLITYSNLELVRPCSKLKFPFNLPIGYLQNDNEMM